ncbi:hypothetical protein EI534_39060, partial [Pseudomonas frederiksbergensis]|nr:hypothetical protein [Pseudomonas frederiksbergensis]
MTQVISQIDGAAYPTPKLTQLTSDLKALLVENLNLIDKKSSTPSIVVTLSSTNALIEEINQLIQVEQARIN